MFCVPVLFYGKLTQKNNDTHGKVLFLLQECYFSQCFNFIVEKCSYINLFCFQKINLL